MRFVTFCILVFVWGVFPQQKPKKEKAQPALSAIQTTPTSNPNKLPSFFAKFDTNKDGIVEKDEMIKIYDSMDLNHDGKLTLEEWKFIPPTKGNPKDTPHRIKKLENLKE